MNEEGGMATPTPAPYVGDRRVSGPIELEYQFMYDRDVLTPLPLLADYKGPIPARETIILFGGPRPRRSSWPACRSISGSSTA
jgi:hypothetical protein